MTPDDPQRVQAVIDETQATIDRFEATGMDDEVPRIMKICWRFWIMPSSGNGACA